jgi:hypothetical protein
MAGLPEISNIAELQKFNVNLEEFEKIKQSLYDSAAYAAAGATNIVFFQQPQGQGGKTLEDTNMTLAGQLPTNQLFLIESIEVLFFPTDPSAGVTENLPAAFGAQQAANIINDAYIFYRSGSLVLEIGSKDYLREAPLQKFPGKTRFHVEGALSDVSTAGADLQSRIAYGVSEGRPYIINPPLLLIENQNFKVELRWPNGAQAITNPARIFVVLDGVLFRRAQ